MKFDQSQFQKLKLDPLWTRRTALLFSLICVLSCVAYLGRLPLWVQRVPHFDWLMHFLFLGSLGFCLHKALCERAFPVASWMLPLGPCLASVWSLCDESLQLFSPNRVFSMADMAANLLGIWLFFAVQLYFEKRKAIV